MSATKINIWIVGLTALLISCGTSSEDLLNQAKTQKALGHFDQALVLVSQAQAADPEDENPYLFSAELYEALGDINIALDQCILGLEKNPTSVALLLKTSQYFSDADEWEKAREYAEKAHEVAPDNANVLYHLGKLMLDQDLTDEAFNWYSKSFDKDSTAINAIIGMGNIKLAEKNAVEAETFFNKAKKINPMSAEAYAGLAQTGELKGQDPDEILELYKNAIKRKNNVYEIWKPYLKFMTSAGKIEVSDLKSFNKIFPHKIEGHHILAQYYINLAQIESETWLAAAVKECETALDIDPEDDLSHGLLAEIYLIQGKPRLALLRAQIAFEINPIASYRELLDQAKNFR